MLLLDGLVDDAGLFPPSWLPMDQALARHRASSHPMLSGRFLVPADRVGELVVDEPLTVHLIGDDVPALDVPDLVTVVGVEVRSGLTTELPCYVEGVAPSQLAGKGVFGKLRCGGVRIPSVEQVASYVREAVSVGLAFKGTAGMHAAVRGWEDTKGEPHHGYLNLLLAVHRAHTGGDVLDVLRSTDASALADEARSLTDEQAKQVRATYHSYGSCDTARPLTDAQELSLV